MAWFYDKFNCMKNMERGLTCLEVSLSYTVEEESWLTKRLGIMDEIHKSVGLNEEIRKEFPMYSLDVPVSKSFVKGNETCLNMFHDCSQ